MTRWSVTLLTTFALAACSPMVAPPSDAGLTPADAGAADAGAEPADAGVDAGAQDAGTWRVRWASSAPFPTLIDHHTTFVARAVDGGGSALYVVGGQITDTDELLDGVWAAGLLPDGGLDSWVSVGKLNATRGFHGMVVAPSGIFFAGGISNTASGVSAVSEVSSFGFRADGGLGTFTHSFFQQAALHPTLSAAQGWLVMVGGSGSAGPHTGVWTVKHAERGYEVTDAGVRTLATRAADLPEPRSHHSTVVYQDHLFVIGGFTTQDRPLTDILRSTHDDAGVVSGWTVAGTISDAPWTHSTFVHEGSVFVVGGGSFRANPPWLTRVRRAPFLSDGGVGAFVDVLDGLPEGRAHVHQTPFFNGFIYSIGGRVGAPNLVGYASTERVDIGRLTRE